MRIDRKIAELRGSMGFLFNVGARVVMFLLEMFCFFFSR